MVLPHKGMVSPLEFIPVAEESGLIVRIGEMVIEKALKDLKDWERKGINDIHIAINLSARQFKTKYFENTVAKLLENTLLTQLRCPLKLPKLVLLKTLMCL